MRIYVGNLAEETSEDELRGWFLPHGRVKDVRLAREKDGKPRGFGIVIFEESKGKAAIEALSAGKVGGRVLKVREARGKKG